MNEMAKTLLLFVFTGVILSVVSFVAVWYLYRKTKK
jgi:cbb3-type cytochrome oxidase subunit 3